MVAFDKVAMVGERGGESSVRISKRVSLPRDSPGGIEGHFLHQVHSRSSASGTTRVMVWSLQDTLPAGMDCGENEKERE